jgi:phosphoglycerate dehydrogenase-like enzyme|tara:strand:+ start:501 stop:1286 length:786 start_codon:yes stop_codon:yes gene_type:complete
MIVLKDKKDIKFAPTSFLKDYEWESHGQYDSLDFVNPDVKVLSVQFTKVGEKTYKAFPNLEWIIVRQHGFDNVNIAECEKRGIGVVTTKPFAQSTADWINSFIEETDNVALIGYGSIGSKVKANNIQSFLRKSTYDSLKDFNTLVVTVQPEGNDRLISEKILSKFKGKLISVSRSTVIDNISLYKYIDNITHAYVDTLDDHLRQYLIDTGKVTYTKHTAFEYGFSYENNTEYFGDLNSIIVDCLNNNVDKPILSRIERVTF